MILGYSRLTRACAGAPFIVLNTVIGSLAAYGLGGLNAKFTAVLLNVMLVALQSLVATQFQIACVLATPNQDLVRTLGGWLEWCLLCSSMPTASCSAVLHMCVCCCSWPHKLSVAISYHLSSSGMDIKWASWCMWLHDAQAAMLPADLSCCCRPLCLRQPT